MYGAVMATLRSVGVLKAPTSCVVLGDEEAPQLARTSSGARARRPASRRRLHDRERLAREVREVLLVGRDADVVELLVGEERRRRVARVAARAPPLAVEERPAALRGRRRWRRPSPGDEAVEGRVAGVLRPLERGDRRGDVVVRGVVAEEPSGRRRRTPGSIRTFATTSSGDFCPISMGFKMGSFACSSSVGARPSQNCVALNMALSTVGALRCPRCLPTPSDVTLWSTKPAFGSWHVEQETVPSTRQALVVEELVAELGHVRRGRALGRGRRWRRGPARRPAGGSAARAPSTAA